MLLIIYTNNTDEQQLEQTLETAMDQVTGAAHASNNTCTKAVMPIHWSTYKRFELSYRTQWWFGLVSLLAISDLCDNHNNVGGTQDNQYQIKVSTEDDLTRRIPINTKQNLHEMHNLPISSIGQKC